VRLCKGSFGPADFSTVPTAAQYTVTASQAALGAYHLCAWMSSPVQSAVMARGPCVCYFMPLSASASLFPPFPPPPCMSL
jgi:hypothetical protein